MKKWNFCTKVLQYAKNTCAFLKLELDVLPKAAWVVVHDGLPVAEGLQEGIDLEK